MCEIYSILSLLIFYLVFHGVSGFRNPRKYSYRQILLKSWEAAFEDNSAFEDLSQEDLKSYDVSVGLYGEILPSSLRKCIDECGLKITDEDVVYDLGSGVGKIVTQFAFETDARKCVGIEMGQHRHNIGSKVVENLRLAGRPEANKIELIHGDFLDVDWQSDATILFINAVVFPEIVVKEIERRVKGQNALRYIFLFGAQFSEDILSDKYRFNVYRQVRINQTWILRCNNVTTSRLTSHALCTFLCFQPFPATFWDEMFGFLYVNWRVYG